MRGEGAESSEVSEDVHAEYQKNALLKPCQCSGSQWPVLTRFEVRRRRMGRCASWEHFVNKGFVESLAAFRGQRDMGNRLFRSISLRRPPVTSSSASLAYSSLPWLGSLLGHCPLFGICPTCFGYSSYHSYVSGVVWWLGRLTRYQQLQKPV